MCKPVAFVAVPDGLGWDGWYFEDNYLCSPGGDRLTVMAVKATIMARQTETVRDLMYWRPSERRTDVVMHHYLDSPQPSQFRKVKKELPIIIEGMTYEEPAVSQLRDAYQAPQVFAGL